MTSTTTYKTENGKTVKVESETEKGGSTEKIEKTVDDKKQKSKGKTESDSDIAEVEEI